MKVNNFHTSTMTNKIEKVSPTIIDGIEFYCSADGTKTGMSKAGLAKFVGMSKRTLGRLFDELSSGGHKMFKLDESTSFEEMMYHENLRGVKQTLGGGILKAEFCAKVCAFVAYHHKGGNEIAIYSLNKFSTIGINNFIQEVTGYKKEGSLSQTDDLLAKLVDSVDKMQVKLDKCNGYLKARVEYPGLEKWMNALDDIEPDSLALEGDVPLYTLVEAMAIIYPGMTFSRGQRTGIGRAIAETYKNMKLEPAAQIKRIADDGYHRGFVCGYPETMFPVIKACVLRVLSAM